MSDPQTTWEFMVEVAMSGFVTVEADTYEEALDQVRSEWSMADVGDPELLAIFEKKKGGVYEQAWIPDGES